MPDEGGIIESLNESTLIRLTKFAVSSFNPHEEFKDGSLLIFLPVKPEDSNIIVRSRNNAILRCLFIEKICI